MRRDHSSCCAIVPPLSSYHGGTGIDRSAAAKEVATAPEFYTSDKEKRCRGKGDRREEASSGYLAITKKGELLRPGASMSGSVILVADFQQPASFFPKATCSCLSCLLDNLCVP